MTAFDFDHDELLFFVLASASGVGWAYSWYVGLFERTSIRRDRAIFLALALTPVAGLAGVGVVLSRWADPCAVVGHIDYQLLFLAGGAVWLGLTALAAQALGIRAVDDAMERTNPAAAWAACGALLGSAAIYAGANIGAGPTIYTTLLPALEAWLLWLANSALLEAVSHVSEAIAVDRDVASGLRHGAWLIATGLILGRSVAGDWTGLSEQISDLFTLAWPCGLLSAAAIVVQRLLRPTPARPVPSVWSAGVAPAVLWTGAAIAYLFALPPPALVPAAHCGSLR